MTDCVCGTCPACRAADREIDRQLTPPTTPPGPLSERVQRILAEGAGHQPPPEPDPQPEPKPKPVKKPRAPRSRAKHLEPTPCARCGGLRAVIAKGRGRVLAGSGDLCEVCDGKDRYTAVLAADADGTKPIPKGERLRLTQALDRILVDGRAFHPNADHGALSGFTYYGCRCPHCCTAKKSIKSKESTPA